MSNSNIEQCLLCGETDNLYQDIEIENIGKHSYCDGCFQDLVCDLKITHPEWIFLVKPRRKKSDLNRLIFDTVEEFEDWCEENNDILDCYVFGMYKSDNWSVSSQLKWLSNEYDCESDNDFYWIHLDDDFSDRDEPEKVLVSLYKEGDNKLWSWYTDMKHLSFSVSRKVLDSYVKKLDDKITNLKSCREKLLYAISEN